MNTYKSKQLENTFTCFFYFYLDESLFKVLDYFK